MGSCYRGTGRRTLPRVPDWLGEVFSQKSPDGKLKKAATDLSLVLRGLQKKCVNQCNGVGLNLLVGAVSMEREGRWRLEDWSARDGLQQSLADCHTLIGGQGSKALKQGRAPDPAIQPGGIYPKTAIRELCVSYWQSVFIKVLLKRRTGNNANVHRSNSVQVY